MVTDKCSLKHTQTTRYIHQSLTGPYSVLPGGSRPGPPGYIQLVYGLAPNPNRSLPTICPDFAPQGWCWTNRPGILHPRVGAGQIAPGFCTPKVGAGQNVPEFCKAGIRLNKIMGKIAMGQNHGCVLAYKCVGIISLSIPFINFCPPLTILAPFPSGSFLIP